jgi:hypothetical protein
VIMSEEQRRAVAAGLAWLFDTAQPAGAIVTHHGATLVAGDRRYCFVPRGYAGHAVVVVEVAKLNFDGRLRRHTAVLEPDELAVLDGLLTEMGHEVVDTWNGHPGITGSVALARPVEPSLLAAVDRYRAGCPDHGGSVFCACGWYAAGNRLLVHPTPTSREESEEGSGRDVSGQAGREDNAGKTSESEADLHARKGVAAPGPSDGTATPAPLSSRPTSGPVPVDDDQLGRG